MKRVKPVDTNFCRLLKGKNPYGMLEGGENDWLAFDDANTIFWCVKHWVPVGLTMGRSSQAGALKRGHASSAGIEDHLW